MTCTPSLAPSSASASPTRRFRSSDSTTHGPAMRKGAAPKCTAMSISSRGDLGGGGGRGGGGSLGRRGGCLGSLAAALTGRSDEAGEQGVRSRGPGLELRVELAADEPGVV